MTDSTATRGNLAPPAPEFPWPGGKKAALFPAFDVDSESVWLGADPENAKRLVTRSYGGYEARVGVPKILELLNKHDTKATFFVTGWSVDAFPEMCESIHEQGHEIAHHGYLHLRPDVLSSERLVDEIERGFEAIDRLLGLKPVGYRAPWGESTAELLQLIHDHGINYSSSWRDDIRPYRHVLQDGPGPIEIPVNYAFDDWTYGLNHRSSPRPLFPSEHVLSIWNGEFDRTCEWGGVTTMVMHPQVTGRPMRLGILDEFLTRVRERDDVWVATGAQIASNFEAHEKATEGR